MVILMNLIIYQIFVNQNEEEEKIFNETVNKFKIKKSNIAEKRI